MIASESLCQSRLTPNHQIKTCQQPKKTDQSLMYSDQKKINKGQTWLIEEQLVK